MKKFYYGLSNYIAVVIVLLTFAILIGTNVFTETISGNNDTDVYLKAAIIATTVIFGLVSGIVLFDYYMMLKKQWYFKKGVLLYFSFNFYLMFAKLEQSERKEKLYFPIHKKNSNLETKDLVVVAIMLCLAIVFDLFTSYLLPTLPLGGSISLKYIPLIFVALLYRPSLSLLCNLAFSLLCILYTKSAFIVNAWSYILDYFIPINCIILLAFTKKITNIKSFSSIFYIIFVPSLIMWISQTLGGVLVWNVLFPTAMWPGLNTVAYSATYNFINVFIMSFPVLLLLFQPINLVISKIAN